MAELEREEDEPCVDLCPLFEDRLVSHAASEVFFDFGHGARLSVRQAPGDRRVDDFDAPACCPTERTTRTGAVVWDGAVVLAALVAHSGTGKNPAPRLLELGAGGHGLVGLAALLSGFCCAATLTDREPLLEQLRLNVAASLGHDAALAGMCDVRPLLWGDTTSLSELGDFDIVVAADCVYDVESADVLAETIAAVLVQGQNRGEGRLDAEALVSFDRALDRHVAYASFLSRCASLGLVSTELDQAPGKYQKPSVAVFRLSHGDS